MNSSQQSLSLVLADGRRFDGFGFGTNSEVVGEVVFNTSMTGYQEMLTDPSYRGQILVLTYPLIGNYGISRERDQSRAVQVRGLVVCVPCHTPSHVSSEQNLDSYLRSNKVPAVGGVDTRAIARHLRDKGVMMGAIVNRATETKATLELIQNKPNYNDDRLLTWGVEGARLEAEAEAENFSVVVLDYGVKRAILEALKQRGCAPYLHTPSSLGSLIQESELAGLPATDGVVISPGPGDPAHLDQDKELVKAVIKAGIPLMGICLGHQLVARALGATTHKLKFGHRGGNHPVLEHASGKVTITAHNHGYTVDRTTLPTELKVTHTNLNDGTVEGLRHLDKPVFTIQYHPEASPGPNDADPLFDRFIDAMQTAKDARN